MKNAWRQRLTTMWGIKRKTAQPEAERFFIRIGRRTDH
jgi:hypothetical protein